jgi:hypothetical protein
MGKLSNRLLCVCKVSALRLLAVSPESKTRAEARVKAEDG